MELSEDECSGCGLCVDRCQLGAFELNDSDSIVTLHQERCVGCGLCVTTCPTGALELKRRPEPIAPPADVPSMMAAIVAERKQKTL